MSRLREKVPAALIRGLITLLLALGMAMPLLAAAGQTFLMVRCALICAAVSFCCAALSLRRRLLGWGLLAATVFHAVLFAFGGGFFQQTLSLMRALVLLIRNVPMAVTLNGDALCVQLAVLLTLFCWMLSSPDMDVTLPVTLAAGLLAGEWMLGLRRETLYMLPMLPGLLLIFAFTHSFASAPEARPIRTTPWAIPLAAALLALAWLIAPQEGVKSPTLARWAEELREALNDRFFFQQERARYTLASDGWMPLGEHRLGGRPDPDERLVMRVSVPDTTYLRGAILDTYTGAYWYDSVSARRYYWSSPLHRAKRDEVTQAAYPLNETLPEQQLSVQFTSAGASSLFLPQRVHELITGERMTPYFNTGSEIFITRNLEPGDAYGASFLSMKATDSGMAALAEKLAQADDPQYAAAVGAYTGLPTHIQKEIYDIAAAVTANCTSDWQKAIALRRFLRDNYRYSLDVQDPPRDVDFVAWFLLGERKGYCTYFASAMTVLCRMAGLPARYVEGYAANPGSGGIAEVRGTNAHAWTEIYLNGLGWVTFDATPGWAEQDDSGSATPPPPGRMASPTPPPPEQTPPPLAPSPSPSPSPDPSEQPAPDQPPPAGPQGTPTPTPQPSPTPTPQPDPPDAEPPARRNLWWLWLLLALALLTLLALRIRLTEPLYHASRLSDDAAALLLLWQAALQCASRLKTPIRPDETPLSYAVRAESALGVPLTEAAQAVSALRYGRRAPRRASLRAAGEAYRQLRKRLSPPQKAVMALKRALTWNKNPRRHA